MKISNNTTECSTTTVMEARLQIAQATRSPKMIERTFTNKFGKVRVKGKIGQIHMNVLSAIRYVGKPAKTPDGRIKLLVDMARVRRVSGVTGGRLDDMLDDLMQVIIEIKEPVHVACLGHLIDHIDKAQRADGTFVMARNPLGGERHMWRVTLGEAACKLLGDDLLLGYDPSPITALKAGISQAVARHLMTHKNVPNGGWIIDNLITAVAGELNQADVLNRRRELKNDAAGLREIGFEISLGRVVACSQGAMTCSQGAMACSQGAAYVAKAR